MTKVCNDFLETECTSGQWTSYFETALSNYEAYYETVSDIYESYYCEAAYDDYGDEVSPACCVTDFATYLSDRSAADTTELDDTAACKGQTFEDWAAD